MRKYLMLYIDPASWGHVAEWLHSFEPLDDAGDEMRVPHAAARRLHLALAKLGGDAAHREAAVLQLPEDGGRGLPASSALPLG